MILHHPHSRGSEDWVQYLASTISNVYIIEASKFSETVTHACRSKHLSLVLTTHAKITAEIPGQELATARCLIYERWPSIAKNLFHKNMAWDEYDMLRWISFMEINFAPCSLIAKN